VPRPDLAGAVVLKALAAQADHKRGRERRPGDIASLLSLVADPYSLRDELGRRNCRRVGAVTVLTEDDHPAWRHLDPSVRSNAKGAFTLVTGADVS
jgi:hypothetical protein